MHNARRRRAIAIIYCGDHLLIPANIFQKQAGAADPDSDHLNADPGPSFYPNAYPDPSFYFNAVPDPSHLWPPVYRLSTTLF